MKNPSEYKIHVTAPDGELLDTATARMIGPGNFIVEIHRGDNPRAVSIMYVEAYPDSHEGVPVDLEEEAHGGRRSKRPLTVRNPTVSAT